MNILLSAVALLTAAGTMTVTPKNLSESVVPSKDESRGGGSSILLARYLFITPIILFLF